jgi:quercetin dioxygenase-like cupin family protein
MPAHTRKARAAKPAPAQVRELVEFMWKQFPGHFDGAYSKVLVGLLEGEGLLELGSKKHVVRPKSFAFIPPRLPHALYNTGVSNLVFFVITTVTDNRPEPVG